MHVLSDLPSELPPFELYNVWINDVCVMNDVIAWNEWKEWVRWSGKNWRYGMECLTTQTLEFSMFSQIFCPRRNYNCEILNILERRSHFDKWILFRSASRSKSTDHFFHGRESKAQKSLIDLIFIYFKGFDLVSWTSGEFDSCWMDERRWRSPSRGIYCLPWITSYSKCCPFWWGKLLHLIK